MAECAELVSNAVQSGFEISSVTRAAACLATNKDAIKGAVQLSRSIMGWIWVDNGQKVPVPPELKGQKDQNGIKQVE